MPHLKHLTIQGFRSIERMDLRLDAVNVLIGPNGAGKSNLVSFFRLLGALVRRDLQLAVQRAGRAEALLYYGPQVTPHLRARLSFPEVTYTFELGATDDGRLVFEREAVGRDEESEQVLGRRHEETKLPEARDQAEVAQAVLDSVQAWAVYHFHDTGCNGPLREQCPHFSAWVGRLERLASRKCYAASTSRRSRSTRSSAPCRFVSCT